MNEYNDELFEDGSSPDEYMDDNEDEEDIDEAQELREQLCDIPLGEIKKLKDKVGLKKYNQVLFGVPNEHEAELTETKRKEVNGSVVKKRWQDGKEIKKKVKSEPVEISSKKKKFPKLRIVVKNDKRSVRDPRFNDLSGEFNEDLFQKSYFFLDEMKKKEYTMVNKQLKKVKNPEQRTDLLRLKQKLDDEQKLEVEKTKRREFNKQRKATMDEETKAGKKPYYLKNSDKKKIELAGKYRELKASGKLENFMMKKRKRNAQKDKKNLPELKMT